MYKVRCEAATHALSISEVHLLVCSADAHACWGAVGASGGRHYRQAAQVVQWERIYVNCHDHFSKWA